MTSSTPDYPDWQQPVAVVDQAVQLNGQVIVLRPGQGGPQFDVSSANSLALNITLPSSSVGARFQLTVIWYEDTVGVGQQTLTFHSFQSYTSQNVSELYWQIPVRGGQVALSIDSPTTAPVAVSAFASTRELQGGISLLTNDSNSKVMLNYNAGSIPAGGTSAIQYVPPVARALMLRSNQHTDVVQVNANGLCNSVAGITVVPFGSLITGDGWNQGAELTCVQTALEVSILNTDTGAHLTTLDLWDVS